MYKQAFTYEFNFQARTLRPEAVFGPSHTSETGEFSYIE